MYQNSRFDTSLFEPSWGYFLSLGSQAKCQSNLKCMKGKARVSEAEQTVYENDHEYDDDEVVCNEINVVMKLMMI